MKTKNVDDYGEKLRRGTSGNGVPFLSKRKTKVKTMTREEEVAVFNKAAGKKPFDGEGFDDSIVNCFVEECQELFEALGDYITEPSVETRKNLVKEWADTQVTLSNIAWYMDIPAQAAFNRVHKSNMTKVVNGKVYFRDDGKVMKPDTYEAPDMSGL